MKFALAAPLLAAALMSWGAAGATTVRIHYDAGAGKQIQVRADKGPMSWSRGVPATPDNANLWVYTWPDELGEVQMKPALGDDKVSIGGVYKLAAGSTIDIYPFFGPPFGKLKIVPKFDSPQLGNSRALRIFLPASYDENKAKRYPVLYMHDGQNLFDARTAGFGVEWNVDETINRLVAAGQMEEVIVVGIDNTPDRIAEYTPCCDPKHGGGKLDAYRAFIVNTVKPYIDQNYRSLPGKANSALLGSSLGAVASLAIAQRHPDLFGKAGAMSGAFWWNKGELYTKLTPRVDVLSYLDAGTSDDGMEDTVRMRDAMLAQGYQLNKDLLFYSAQGGSHNEKSWAARLDKPLLWFFPWSGTR